MPLNSRAKSAWLSRTRQFPRLRFEVDGAIFVVDHGKVEHHAILHTPRQKDEIAFLSIEWKPLDIDVTVRHG